MKRNSDACEAGQAAYVLRDWDAAFGQLSEGDALDSLAPSDLELLAISAYLVGRDEADQLMARSFRAWVEAGDADRAAVRGFWLALLLGIRGDAVQSDAWLARATAQLGDRDTPSRGDSLLLRGLKMLEADPADAQRIFDEVRSTGTGSATRTWWRSGGSGADNP